MIPKYSKTNVTVRLVTACNPISRSRFGAVRFSNFKLNSRSITPHIIQRLIPGALKFMHSISDGNVKHEQSCLIT